MLHGNENSGPIDIALNKYDDHPSILKVKNFLMYLPSLTFRK